MTVYSGSQNQSLSSRNELAAILRKKIQDTGPLLVSDYMELCLQHPLYGYYRQQQIFGKAGDFITAPEISPFFGEMIGGFCCYHWQFIWQFIRQSIQQNWAISEELALIELGPGRGTLMADIARMFQRLPNPPALHIYLVENHEGLRKIQKKQLQGFGTLHWVTDIETLPQMPFFLIANEFFDALPVQQWVKTEEGWAQRAIDCEGSQFCFCERPAPFSDWPSHCQQHSHVQTGSIFETSPAIDYWFHQIVSHHQKAVGYSLLIDYGYNHTDFGESLQAVVNHNPVSILDYPGCADLSAHVNFSHLKSFVENHSNPEGRHTPHLKKETPQIFGPQEQGNWLCHLGIRERAQHVISQKQGDEQFLLNAGLRRLIDPLAMGSLYKILGLASHGLPPPAGF